MSCLIEKEADAEMKQAYTEMLEGCLMEPDNRIWYAVWNMELKNVPGTIVGDFCFKGLGKDGVVEIGYGLRKEFRHQGYMVETGLSTLFQTNFFRLFFRYCTGV